jgi:acyl-CoA thioester hydrolase
MIKTYQHDIVVTDEDVDVNGHVNNVQYVQWMQDAAIMHSKTVKCLQLTKRLGAIWVVRTHKIEYLRPAYPGDYIKVLTWVHDFRKVLSLRKYKFVRDSDEATLAEGETDWVFVDAKSGRPRFIPDEVKATFEI